MALSRSAGLNHWDRPSDKDSTFQRDVDVLIIGGGILGSSVAFYLSEEGIDVLLIERQEINSEASGKNAGTLHAQTQSYLANEDMEQTCFTASIMIPYDLEAIKLWQQFQEIFEDLQLKIKGGLMIAETEAQLGLLQQKARMERSCGLDVEVLSREELQSLAPYLSRKVIGAAYTPVEGFVNPLSATRIIAESAVKKGARISSWTELKGLKVGENGFEALTNRGVISCKRVVNTAGPWSSWVASLLGMKFPINGFPQCMNVTEPAPQMVDHLIMHAGHRLSIKQAFNGNLIIGGGWPSEIDSITGSLQLLYPSILGNIQVFLSVIPRLKNINLIRTWPAISPRTIDSLPLVGESPGVPGFYFAVMHNGYTRGPLFAKLLSEYMVRGQTSFDLKPFSLERF